MRTDAKIGILAGLVIALGVIVYVFSPSGKKPEPQESKPASPAVALNEPPRDLQPPPGSADEPLAPPAESEEVVTFPGWPAKTEAERTTLDLEEGHEPAAEPPLAPPLIAEEQETQLPAPTGPAEPVGKADSEPIAVDVGEPQVYVVQAGDLGFWGIAAKVYKASSRWPLIRDANPDADTNNLRPGQRLRIPALPTEQTKPRVQHGLGQAEPPALAGGQPYEVQPGDKGFWAIAAKLYKDGSKWHRIEKANPGLDSWRLPPGTRLIIPSLSEADRPAEPVRTVQHKPAPRRAPRPLELPTDGRPRFYDVVRAEL